MFCYKQLSQTPIGECIRDILDMCRNEFLIFIIFLGPDDTFVHANNYIQSLIRNNFLTLPDGN